MQIRRSHKIKIDKLGPRAMRKDRRTKVLTAVVAGAVVLLLAYQAITALIEGDYVMGENYLGQPVGPGLQLAALAAAAVVGLVATWQYFHPKPKPRKKPREKYHYFTYPHERAP